MSRPRDEEPPVIDELLGDYRVFFRDQLRRLSPLGIAVESYPVSHIAFRAEGWQEYVEIRDRLEDLSRANVENEWSGRPISKLLLKEPVALTDNHDVELVELIPPPHRPEYPTRFEHVGFVVGEDFERFAKRHKAVLTGQQDQGPINQPLFVTFDNGRSVKFHRFSLREVVETEGRRFDGFHHAEP